MERSEGIQEGQGEISGGLRSRVSEKQKMIDVTTPDQQRDAQLKRFISLVENFLLQHHAADVYEFRLQYRIAKWLIEKTVELYSAAGWEVSVYEAPLHNDSYPTLSLTFKPSSIEKLSVLRRGDI
jgi:hypothetical protein